MGTNAPDPNVQWQTGEPGDQPAPQPPAEPTETPAAPTADPPAPAPAAPPEPTPEPAPAPAPPAAPAAAAPTSQEELLSVIEGLRTRLGDLERNVSTGQLGLSETDAELAQKVDELRAEFEAWPQRGGVKRDDGSEAPQPYDLKGHGLPQPGVTRDYLPGGAPDELSPVVIAHNKPILSAGNAGSAVEELAALLAKVGYPNSISKGQNHAFSFDDTITAAVDAFKRDFHVREDPSQFRPGEDDRMVGPWLWEALIRAAKLVEHVVL